MGNSKFASTFYEDGATRSIRLHANRSNAAKDKRYRRLSLATSGLASLFYESEAIQFIRMKANKSNAAKDNWRRLPLADSEPASTCYEVEALRLPPDVGEWQVAKDDRSLRSSGVTTPRVGVVALP
ncbi:hypothetical protein [Haliscomenobacter sp.]|uniref:hypothetical protein n=1 Tax=Haliscomenobacter sp. TaxID=2717303 RepID=UPI00359479B9